MQKQQQMCIPLIIGQSDSLFAGINRGLLFYLIMTGGGVMVDEFILFPLKRRRFLASCCIESGVVCQTM